MLPWSAAVCAARMRQADARIAFCRPVYLAKFEVCAFMSWISVNMFVCLVCPCLLMRAIICYLIPIQCNGKIDADNCNLMYEAIICTRFTNLKTLYSVGSKPIILTLGLCSNRLQQLCGHDNIISLTFAHLKSPDIHSCRNVYYRGANLAGPWKWQTSKVATSRLKK